MPLRLLCISAHPDDECLWLSSVLAVSSRVVFAFGDPYGRPDVAAARRRAVAEARSGDKNLIATGRLSLVSTARNTSPMPPAPRSSSIL